MGPRCFSSCTSFVLHFLRLILPPSYFSSVLYFLRIGFDIITQKIFHARGVDFVASTPLSRASPSRPTGRGRTSPPFTPFTPSTPRLTTPRHVTPRHASPWRLATPRQASQADLGWILEAHLASKIQQNRWKIDAKMHSVLDSVLISILHGFSMDFGSIFGSKIETTWHQNRILNRYYR